MPLKQSREAGKVPDKCALPCTLLSFGQGAFFLPKGHFLENPCLAFYQSIEGEKYGTA
ncbi:hypothetical protein B4096_1394 [Heyndrickxia coagulans]|uniref:Uncharacterized protein n=1 Tax=Heyndrickxia coagulans TaxID=1398 RepID=A0A150KJ48_HEYCO|nr:hypothetical protein BCO26_2900 [Heyndrickxia coagulans 2-6]KYC73159.1 hypothetical protein B4099_1517 [Heyndrickxia coagulans]KYC88574.1 hypothetical protein B4096_1394 [Heyndrickxia coagulans]